MSDKPYKMTLADFRTSIWRRLENLPDDTEITFGSGDLSFYRTKNREYRADDMSPKVVQIEFNQVYEVLEDPEENA
ncbi:hypothetical protein PCA20602_02707 [Pandoraea capi]|uniref:Uncharacterized protein n=1 Tax=Pandoraea capi TaxID=2508286 RepID=A0ABY6W0Y6_9BURK|nr:hypothetical protein [Pandoraea capi]VVE12485.1 hypothetical protein PCA20602_02707 [Pandoraea capi]